MPRRKLTGEAKKASDANRAAKQRVAIAKWQQKQTELTNEIGDLPKVANPRRKAACRKNLFKFLTTYFPHSTGLRPFSADHRGVIKRMEGVVLKGGRQANVVYREFAKTTISENTILWAMLYGHRRFGLLTGVNIAASSANIDSLKMELSENDLLLEDFPEVCYPIWELDGKAQKCRSQTYHGEQTHIIWRADTIVLPTIPQSPASGAIIVAKPFAKARGVKFKRPDGENARPDLIMADDVQDDESAFSPLQVAKNLGILKRNLLHTRAHRSPLAVIANGTVIAQHDMMEQLLADPAWEGQRIPFVKSWSKVHDTFWLQDYATVRRSFDKAIAGDMKRAHREATALYRANRKKADAGCKVSWKERYEAPLELSAIQHAYNVLIDDGPEAFASEYQNEPLAEDNKFQLTAEWIASKTNGLDRGVVPMDAEFVTAHVDVHLRVLYYTVCAWSKTFTGSVIDYGTYPDQPIPYFAQDSAPACMAQMVPGSDEDAWILAGLTKVTDTLLGHRFRREDGAEMSIGMELVDAKWGEKNRLVKQFCRRHPEFAVRLMPAQGYGMGPAQKYFDEYNPEPGTRVGLAWRIGKPIEKLRWVTVDVNWWKSRVASRLALPLGTQGGIDLFGRDPRAHALFADHCLAERPVETTAKGRTRDVWEWLPSRPDNHFWDNLIGCAVAASMIGAKFPDIEAKTFRRKRSVASRMTAAQAAAMAQRR